MEEKIEDSVCILVARRSTVSTPDQTTLPTIPARHRKPYVPSSSYRLDKLMAVVVASCQPLLAPIPDSPENLPALRPLERGCRNPVSDGDDLYFQATDHQSLGKIRCDTIDAVVNGVVE